MKATAAPHPVPLTHLQRKPRLVGTRATLAALGAGLLAFLGVHEH